MAEAMINNKFTQATIPALSLDSSGSHQQIYRENRTTPHEQVPSVPVFKETRFSKVVEFDIPNPYKRQRASAEITAQNVTLGMFFFLCLISCGRSVES
jgi:hypothetical protein